MNPEKNNLCIFHHNENGVALLLVLWIITLLSVVCAEFSWTMRTETTIVKNFKEGEQAYYTAEAGINRAIIELMRSASSVRRAASGRDKKEDEEEGLLNYWQPGAGAYEFEFEGARCSVTIEDEGNKLGLNPFLRKAKKNPSALKNILTEKMGLEGEERDIVADSMIDWWDKDSNITGVNGAEEDYYSSLDSPYPCRNGEIPVLEELMLVKGIDEKFFFGTAGVPEQKIRLTPEELEQLLSGNAPAEDVPPDEPDEDDNTTRVSLGLGQLFSVHSRSTTLKIDINTASVDQLTLINGIDRSTAQEIVEARKEHIFASTTDRLPQFSNYEAWKNSIQVRGRRSVGYYTIRSRGYSPDGCIARNISCNIMLTRNRCIMMNWQAVD